MNKILTYPKRLLFSNATHLVLIKGNSNFPTTRIVEPPEPSLHHRRALKFDAWRAAAFTFSYKTRIAQFPAEARIISVSNKIQRQTLAGNARFLLIPKAPPSAAPLLPRALVSAPDPILGRFSSSSPPLPPLPLASRSALFETLREITLNIYFRDDCSRRYDGINIIM